MAEEARGGPTGEPKSGGMPPALPPTLPAAAAAESSPDSAPEPHRGLLGRIRTWFVEEGPWWLCSFVFHIILVCTLALLGGRAIEKVAGEAPSFEEAKVEPTAIAPEKIERFDIGDVPEDPMELNTETLNLREARPIGPRGRVQRRRASISSIAAAECLRIASSRTSAGSADSTFRIIGGGPSVKGKGGVGVGIGTGTHAGVGGGGSGFGGRGSGSRKAMLASGGGTKQSELAVLGALNWMARHQLSDGSWSLSGYKSRCKDNTCTGPGKTGDRPAAATALGLLPFLGGRTNARVERPL